MGWIDSFSLQPKTGFLRAPQIEAAGPEATSREEGYAMARPS